MQSANKCRSKAKFQIIDFDRGEFGSDDINFMSSKNALVKYAGRKLKAKKNNAR